MSNPIIVEILSSKVQYNFKLIEYIFTNPIDRKSVYCPHICVLELGVLISRYLTAEQTLHLPLIPICVLGLSKN